MDGLDDLLAVYMLCFFIILVSCSCILFIKLIRFTIYFIQKKKRSHKTNENEANGEDFLNLKDVFRYSQF